jgi:predicted extracellular nuclease
MQDDLGDGLDCSSDAIFVFTDQFPEVLPGNMVEVDGKVVEYFVGKPEDRNLTITEISEPKIRVISQNSRLPEAVVIGYGGRRIPDKVIDDDGLMKFDVETDGIDFYESLESMLVQVNTGVVAGPRNSYNEVTIISLDTVQSETDEQIGVLLLKEDDANPERIILNLNSSNTDAVNLGAGLNQKILGIMDYSYGNYKLNVFGRVNFNEPDFPRGDVVQETEKLTLVSYNLENLSLNDESARFKDIARQITDSLKTPDILVLHEVLDDSGVEDDGTTSAELTISKIIDEIAARSAVEYAYSQIDPMNNQDGGIPGGNIRSIILYREDKGIFLDENPDNNYFSTNPRLIEEGHWRFAGTRKPLAALFEKDGVPFVVIAVHLTSRNADSPLFGNLQPIEKPEELERNEQAALVNQFASRFLGRFPDTRVIVAGDVNDDPWSRTVELMEETSLVDLGRKVNASDRFSYILDGNALQLDYIFTNPVPGLDDEFLFLHLNSVLDYTLQISDHDPVIGFIELPVSP